MRLRWQHIPGIVVAAICLTSGGMAGTATPADGASTEPLGIPMKPDPPLAIDGDLNDWAHVPGAITLDTAGHVTAGREKWTSANDLSAKVWLAWRGEQLYVAADVTDDRIRQTMRGQNLWQGDHIELYLDTMPEAEPARKAFGKGQFHLGFSPGNFQNSGDALNDLKPEAVAFAPPGLDLTGTLVAAQRTEKGYVVEAAIPWSVVGVKAANGLALGVEVGISDTDADTPEQKDMLTLQTTPFKLDRECLVTAALAPADGKAPPVARGFEIAPPFELQPGAQREFTFDVPEIPAGRDAILALQARLAADKAAGYTGAMRLTLNGQRLDAKRLVNKQPVEERVDGKAKNMMEGDRFSIDWAPDFEAADRSPSYALKRARVHPLALRINDLLKPGKNVLLIENTLGTGELHLLVLDAVRYESRAVFVPVPKRGPPMGMLALYVPRAPARLQYNVRQMPDNDLEIDWANQKFRVESEFSTPEPAWRKTGNTYFKLVRTFEKHNDVLLVRDTFTNLTGENLPLMQRHRIPLQLKQVWLGGLSPANNVGSWSDPGNPTSFGINDKVGLGLMPLDDAFRVHSTNYSDGKEIALADQNFVLKPHATHTAEWAVVLSPEPDYFAFLNSLRRYLDVNFPIDGSAAPLRSEISLGHEKEWPDDVVKSFIVNKSAKYVIISISYPRYKGRSDVYAHGTAFLTTDISQWQKEVERRRKLVPGIVQLGYYHCFIDESDEAATKYPDARVLRSDGVQGDYGKTWEKLFFPTEQNSFGRGVAKSIDMIFDHKFDGIYWDEMERSRDAYTYSEPWDGVSADIDLKTMKIRRLKTSVTLISQPWRIAQMQRILARGALMGNGAPSTRTMAKLRFPRFVETGSISNCTLAQLFTPIALGDSHTEETEVDCYHNMLRALDYGCLYYWYNDWTIRPTHPTLTKYMFPTTPLELHNGYIIGKERILTNRSGLFGWDDRSKHEVHVFDDMGHETTRFPAPIVVKTKMQNGKTVTELRLPEDWSAAIIRK